MEFKSEKELQEFVVGKGCFDGAENLRIYMKLFPQCISRVQYLDSLLHLEGRKVLDIGCNYGHYLIHFPQGSVGIELVPRMIDFCRSLDLEVISANLEEDIPVENSSFEVIHCRDVLEHMIAPHKLLTEFYGILKPDGILVLDVRNMDGIGSKYWNSPQHFYAYNRKSLHYLLERAGFKVKRYVVMNPKLSKVIGGFISVRPLLNLMPTLCVIAEKIPEFSYTESRSEIFNPSWMRRT